MEKELKYSVEERLHNIEELLWSLFLTLSLIGIIITYKIQTIWLNLTLISILSISFGNFAVRFFILTEISATYWQSITNEFVQKNSGAVKFVIRWVAIISLIVISKFLMNYSWKATLGTLVIAIVGNIITKFK